MPEIDQERLLPAPEPPDHHEAQPAQEELIDEVIPIPPPTPERFYWDQIKGSVIVQDINDCYEKIVFWRRNLFMLPNGAAGKNFIREITRLLNN